jgi:hypothetical protein
VNIFSKIMADETARLGNPLGAGSGAFMARMHGMAVMAGGRGFRHPKKGPKLSKGGSTRKQREAGAKEIYHRNLKAEADFRARVAGQPGWGIAQINRAIERREHLKS